MAGKKAALKLVYQQKLRQQRFFENGSCISSGTILLAQVKNGSFLIEVEYRPIENDKYREEMLDRVKRAAVPLIIINSSFEDPLWGFEANKAKIEEMLVLPAHGF